MLGDMARVFSRKIGPIEKTNRFNLVFQENFYYIFSIILKLYSVLRKIGKPDFKSLQTYIIIIRMMSPIDLDLFYAFFMI